MDTESMSILTRNRYEQVKPTVIQSNNASISTPIYIGLITELNNEDVAANDARNAAMRQRRLEDARAPLKESKAPDTPILSSMPIEVIAEQPREIPTTHLKSHSSNEVNRNREYKIRRAALGDNPTQEEMAAVKAQGTISVSIDGTAYEGTASDVAQLINALRAA